MRTSLLLSTICFVVFIPQCDSSALSANSSVEEGCVPCNENFCARIRILCPTGTQPTPNFCKCTCECRVPLAPPAQCNPCAIIKCKRGYSCVNDVRTCTGRCEYRCRHCRRNPEPCNGITCGADKFCIPRCNRCGYKCASKKRCPKHPCSGVSCGNNKKCVANFKECTHTCNCQKRCTRNIDPVCGTDGKTYNNKCLLEIATCESRGTIRKKNDGECKRSCTTNPCAFTTCLVGTTCVPDFTTCTAKCERRECTTNPCARTSCFVGNKCVPDFKLCIGICIPQDCPVNNPCDGITCVKGQICVPNFRECSYSCQLDCEPADDLRCIIAACSLGTSPCNEGEKCLPTCNGCIPACEIKRISKPCEKPCPKNIAPVCGSDGVTYDNQCLLEIAICKSGGKIQKRMDGKCCVKNCNTDLLCATTNCPLGSVVVRDECQCTCECKKCQKRCPKILRPVCGTDGKTYNNECLLEIVACESNGKIQKKSDGRCPPVECPITPCAFTLCLVGTTCVPDFKTCTAKCEPRECTTNPCASTTCLVGNKCVPDFKLCIGRCIPQDCPVNNPCDGITCRKGQRCVPNFSQCSYSCQAECNEDIRCIVAACTITSPCNKGEKCLATCNGCVPACEIKRINTPKCPDVCIQIAQPVCGSDGVTYGNGCLLGIANCKSGGKITQVSEGLCPASCDKPCLEIFAPVCGSDEITYDNQCYLDVANCKSGGKLKKVMDGKCCAKGCNKDLICATTRCLPGYIPTPNECGCICSCQRSCDFPCEEEVRIVCGSDNKNYLSECFLKNAICKSGSKTLKKRHDGLCYDDFQKVKGIDLQPICGSDGRTYSNQAFLDIINCLSAQNITKVLNRPCECAFHKTCQDDFVCIAQYNGATVTSCRSKCLPTPCARPQFPERTFCGTDGKTYTQCSLSQARCLSDGKLGIRNNGPCKTLDCGEECKNIHSPVCGSDGMTYSSECHLKREICLRDDNSLTKKHNGPCKEFYRRLEAAEFEPVCASDRNMYSNQAYVGLERCWTNVVTIPCKQNFPRCEFPQNPKPSSYYTPEPIICGSAITLFCKPDCKTCCVSPNTCGPDGFSKKASECGLENLTEI